MYDRHRVALSKVQKNIYNQQVKKTTIEIRLGMFTSNSGRSRKGW